MRKNASLSDGTGGNLSARVISRLSRLAWNCVSIARAADSIASRASVVALPRSRLSPCLATAEIRSRDLVTVSTFNFIRYGTDGNSTLEFDEVTNVYTVDTDGNGPAAPIQFANPDFRVRSLISNLVVRWEFSAGSTLFLVWNHGQSGYASDPSFRIFDELGGIFDDDQQNTLVVKMNYWVSL